MTADEDEAALTWAGEHDPSHVETPVVAKAAGAAPTKTASAANAPSNAAVLPVVASSAFLISLGILGGIYLLYTIGWVVSLQRFYYPPTNALDRGAFEVQQYLAIAAPIAWFASVLWFTRHHSPVRRLVLLLAGAVLLVPWSFVMGS